MLCIKVLYKSSKWWIVSVVSRPALEFFAHMVTSPFPVKSSIQATVGL